MAKTIADVAYAAGVSIATASRALTNSDHAVNVKTRERILRIAQEIGYQPNMLASGLRSGRSCNIGVILESMTSPFTPAIIQSIQECLDQKGYSCNTINSGHNLSATVDAFHSLLGRQVDGFIFIDTNVHSMEQIAPQTDKPFIFIKRRLTKAVKNCISILPDNRYGGQIAAQHLIKTGYKQIAHIGGPEGWDASLDRRAGYLDALKDQGLPVDLFLDVYGNWGMQNGYEAMQEIFESSNKPDAVFVANDAMAVGAIYAIQDRGLKVPQDIAVVGYDDIEFAGLLRPALTTVRQPLRELGEKAVEVLLDLLDGGDKNELTLFIKGELVIRDSCGARKQSLPFLERSKS